MSNETPTPKDAPRMHQAAMDSMEAMFREGCKLERELAAVTRERDEARQRRVDAEYDADFKAVNAREFENAHHERCKELDESHARELALREALEREVRNCPGCHGDGESRAHSIPAPCPRCRDSRAALSTPPPPVVALADLQDPVKLMVNMMRGTIASLTFEQWVKVSGSKNVPPVVAREDAEALAGAIKDQILESPRLKELAVADPSGRAATILAFFKGVLADYRAKNGEAAGGVNKSDPAQRVPTLTGNAGALFHHRV